MKIEPNVNHAALMAQLDAAYGLNVTALSFVPKGEVSLAYRVDCADGNAYFAKLIPNSVAARTTRRNMDTYLALTSELHHRGLLTSVVAPLPTLDGHARTEFAAMPLILFPYFAGGNLPLSTGAWSARVRNQLARDLATLHQSAPLLHSPLPTHSAFDIAPIAKMEDALSALEQVGLDRHASYQSLRALVLPHRAAIEAAMSHLRDLYNIVTSKPTALVLCHSDIHGLNLILDDAGNVHMLDWENVVLAPAEHDLQAFSDTHFAEFLQAYWQAGGGRDIDIDQFAFYNYHRYLDDLQGYALRILHENDDPLQDEQDLEFAKIAGIEMLAQAEDILARIAAAIKIAKSE